MIPLLKVRRAEKEEPSQNTIKTILKTLRDLPQVQQLFLRFDVPIEHLEKIPISFEELPVSAKAKNGKISLNVRLLDDGNLEDQLHYILHETVHVLQQITGEADDYNNLEHYDYIDTPTEIEAFREQIQFIRDQKGDEAADKYLADLLDFHDLDGDERKVKEFQLGGR